MTKMSFANFTWPNNPEQYEEVCVRQPRYIIVGNGEEEYAGLGPVVRVITGSGAFFGSDAYADFKTLQSQMELMEPAILTHPVWGTRRVYLTELKSRMEPKENYVAYSFEFREVDSSGKIPK